MAQYTLRTPVLTLPQRYTRSSDATHTLTRMGTPGFSPSEQFLARGKNGPWTDLYSLGATCYYLITGKVPQDSMERLAEDELLPLAGRKELQGRFSAEFLSAIDKALRISHKDRWQSAQEWMNHLSAAQRAREEAERPRKEEAKQQAARKASEAPAQSARALAEQRARAEAEEKVRRMMEERRERERRTMDERKTRERAEQKVYWVSLITAGVLVGMIFAEIEIWRNSGGDAVLGAAGTGIIIGLFIEGGWGVIRRRGEELREFIVVATYVPLILGVIAGIAVCFGFGWGFDFECVKSGGAAVILGYVMCLVGYLKEKIS